MGAGARILRGHPTHSTLSPEILKCWFIRVYARFVCLVCKYSEKKAQQKRNERKIKRKNERYVDETRKKKHTHTNRSNNKRRMKHYNVKLAESAYDRNAQWWQVRD